MEYLNVDLKNVKLKVGDKIKFTYKGSSQEFFLPFGVYKFTLIGARGGWLYVDGNYGSKVEAVLETKGGIFFAFVGEGENQHPQWLGPSAKYNGGAPGGRDTWGGTEIGASGGGATDIRLEDGVWNEAVSLSSRILVAGGAGGRNTFTSIDGSGATIYGGQDQVLQSFPWGSTGWDSHSGCGGSGGGQQGGGTNSWFYTWNGWWTGDGRGGSDYVAGCYGFSFLEKGSLEYTDNANHWSGIKFSSFKRIPGGGSEGQFINGEILIEVLQRSAFLIKDSDKIKSWKDNSWFIL